MPYDKNSDLPERVKDRLPDRAQDLFRQAFNSTWDEYGHDEGQAFWVTGDAAERDYERGSGSDWRRKKAA